MISKIAQINNDFLKYTAYRIYVQKTRLIILCVCGVLGFPLLGIMTYSQYPANYSASMEFFNLVCVLLMALSFFVVTMLCYSGGITNFEYYCRRDKVDMSYSLPIKNKHRFWGDFLAGILPLCVVYLISVLIGLIFLTFGLMRGGIASHNYHSDFGSVVIIAMIGFFFLLSIYILAVFCAALCGREFESIVYPVIICIIIPAIIVSVSYIIYYDIWQIDVSEQITRLLQSSSPFGFLLGGFEEISNIEPYNDYTTFNGNFLQFVAEYGIFLRPSIMLPFVIINGLFLTGAYYLSKKRIAESTGKAFVIAAASEFMFFLVMFLITAFFTYAMMQDEELIGGYVFGCVITSVIAFLFLDVTAKRGFRRMGYAFLRYAVMMGISVLVSILLVSVNNSGIGEYVPPLDKIKNVSISLSRGDHDNFLFIEYSDNNNVTFSERGNIEKLRNVHVESNKGQKQQNFYFQSYEKEFYQWHNYIQFTYTLKNGRQIKRYVNATTGFDELLQLYTSTEYKGQIVERLSHVRNNSVRSGISISSLLGNHLLSSFKRDTFIDVDRIYDAFKLDYLSETFEERYYSTGKNLGRITFMEYDSKGDSHDTEIIIRPHFTNLIKELKRQEIDAFEKVNYASTRPDLLIRNTSIKASYSGWDWNTNEQEMYVYYTEETAELIQELLDVAQPAYFLNARGYVIHAYNKYIIDLVIPLEYEDLAEKLWKIAENQ